jgi:hypothetical protein
MKVLWHGGTRRGSVRLGSVRLVKTRLGKTGRLFPFWNTTLSYRGEGRLQMKGLWRGETRLGQGAHARAW